MDRLCACCGVPVSGTVYCGGDNLCLNDPPNKEEKTVGGEWRTTRSGYRYAVVKVDELVREAGEPFTWSCGMKNCGAHIQGGEAALAEHRRVVHGEKW